MSDIKLIALDMDGTLLNKVHEVDVRTKEAIQQALTKGVHVVLSTGRSLGTCYPYAEELGLTSYLVTCNGGEIWTMKKELLEQHLLETEVVEKIWNLGEGLGLHMWMTSTEGFFIGERPDNLYDYQWLKFGVDSENPDKLAQVVKELSYFADLEITNSLPTNIEINPKGVSKAKALHRVCNEIGITIDNVMACGDSLNDIKMIQEAGFGVAMGNAQEAIKKVANYVTDTNVNHGVAKAIEKFVLED
ncbi:HAD family phosphatase [Ornithinibacillus massiliensis]|uniref:HAD family phosphatase n=1 Tax=Ornithinibacillus massiliensis TaxID=1944633 RepID=A0ABS5MHB9_9BACI|nr:Cof-type HAD-IIB family hydrolase [Ornithinibacillus massiliensis]MBS3681709.1 HAD family phosphatase [Ornithinibacillus massiliensis]